MDTDDNRRDTTIHTGCSNTMNKAGVRKEGFIIARDWICFFSKTTLHSFGSFLAFSPFVFFSFEPYLMRADNLSLWI